MPTADARIDRFFTTTSLLTSNTPSEMQPLLKAAQAKSILSPEERAALVREAQKNFQTPGETGNWPAITAPVGNTEEMRSLVFFVFNLLKLSGAIQLDKLLANLRNAGLTAQAQYNYLIGMATQISQAFNAAENAEAAFQQAKEQLKAAEQYEAAAQAAVEAAQGELDGLQSDDPRYAQTQEKLRQAQAAFTEAKKSTQQARVAADQAQSASQTAQDNYALLTQQGQIQKFNDALVSNLFNAPLKISEKSATATTALIIAQLIQLLGDKSVKKLQADLETSSRVQKSRQNEMLKKSEEYQEKLRRAEEANKITGCLGKILGGLAMVVGAITSIFGGAGIGVMAVGIGLLAADGITEAVTGQSLTGMMMEPIMKYVLNPLMNIIGDAVKAIFDYTPLGLLISAIDKATGSNIMDTVHAVVTAVAAVAIMVAVAMLAKSAAKFVIKSMDKALAEFLGQSIKQQLQQTFKKLLPAIIKNAAKQMSKALGQVKSILSEKLAKDPATLQATLLWLEKLRLLTHLSSTGVQATGNIVSGNLQAEASLALAEMKINEAAININKDNLDLIIKHFKRESNVFTELTKYVSEVLLQEQRAGRLVLKNMSA